MKNNNTTKQKKISLWLKLLIFVIFIITLVISMSFISLRTDKMHRRVLFFYDDIAEKVVADELAVKVRASLSEDIKAMVDLMLFPPKNIEWRPFFANIGQSTMVAVVDKVCYINLEGNVSNALARGADFKADIALIEKSVHFNFPEVERVVVTFNGQEAFSKPYL